TLHRAWSRAMSDATSTCGLTAREHYIPLPPAPLRSRLRSHQGRLLFLKKNSNLRSLLKMHAPRCTSNSFAPPVGVRMKLSQSFPLGSSAMSSSSYVSTETLDVAETCQSPVQASLNL